VIGAPDDVPVGEIDAMLVRFAGYLAMERGLAQQTVSVRVTALRSLLRFLHVDGVPGLRFAVATAVPTRRLTSPHTAT